MSETHRSGVSARLFRSGVLASVLAMSAGVDAAVPPHDGWVLERTFGSSDPTSGATLNCGFLPSPPAVSTNGEVFAAAGNNISLVRRFAPDGTLIETISTGGGGVTRMATRGSSYLYIGVESGNVLKYDLVANQFVPFSNPANGVRGLTIDANGILYPESVTSQAHLGA